MATIDRSQIIELMSQAQDLEHGPTQIGLLEEAVRLADLLADVPLGFRARTKLIEAANFGGSPEKAMVAFSWSLAQLDRDPGQFSEVDTLWQYKWVIHCLPSFPQLTRAQIAGALADLRQRFERAGYGMRPVLKLQASIARDLGDIDEYQTAHALWLKSPRTGLSDCSTCDLSTEVEFLARNGKEEQAITRAERILKGSARCEEEPHFTLAEVLLPLVRLGRLEEAVKYHTKGYRLIARNRSFVLQVSQHIEFLVLTDNLAKGVKLFETHLTWAMETFVLSERFLFAMASRFLFDRLRASGKKTTKLRLPSTFPLFEASGKYDVAALIEWLDADAAELARRFDARNGNDSFARKIEAKRALEGLVTPFPLRKPVQKKVGSGSEEGPIVEPGKGTDGND